MSQRRAAAVKIFNQSYRVVVRDNLVVEHPHSNGVWYDVGNVEGVFANNYVEGTQIGFFFEISNGVVVAGNVFVNNDQGIRVLNAANAPRISQHLLRLAGGVRSERAQCPGRPLRLASAAGLARRRAAAA